MPAGVFTAYPVAANEPLYAGAPSIAPGSSVVAQRDGLGKAAGIDDGWPFPPAVSPTADDIRHASELRLRIRLRYLARAARPAAPWCVGVD